MSLTFKNLLYEAVDGVARISINRPPLNILNAETLIELDMALDLAKKDASICVVIITAVGDRAFCAGVDIKDHLPEKVGSTLNAFNKVFYALEGLDKPSIAIVRGFALGGGCELAIACDMVIASERAQFGQPEIRVGAIPPIAVALMPRLIGRKKAFELIMTGNSITAPEAKQAGLVNLVVPEEKVEEASRQLIARLKENSPIVSKLARLALRETADLSSDKALEEATDIYLNLLMRTEDAVEGLNAFLEKRKPQWKGK